MRPTICPRSSRRPSDGVKKLKAGQWTRDQLKKSGQTPLVIDTPSIDKGEIFVVMGVTGQSTIRMVNGLPPITAGSMTLTGSDLVHISKTRLRAASVSPWSFSELRLCRTGRWGERRLRSEIQSELSERERAEEALVPGGLRGRL